MVIGDIIIDWIDNRLMRGEDTFSSHDFGDCRLYGLDKFGEMHNIDSYTREWRRLREKNLIKGVKIETIDNSSRETTWRIVPQAISS